ncbi:hypothetical protein CDAR_410501 [Caerostris darwini]|uniref:Uncharacterized protein n=1 Tax=Caerostris darwini TaxID=1538125 RepID=A0AAV4QGN3_9ARAC|nr:hypothetical protein CDAR_410501 [Caerostris darwini]
MSPKRTILLQNRDTLFSLAAHYKSFICGNFFCTRNLQHFPRWWPTGGIYFTSSWTVGNEPLPHWRKWNSFFARGSDTPLIIPDVALSDLPSIMEMHVKIFRKCP